MAMAIIVVIVTWIGVIATRKWIWTLVKHRFSYMVEKREPISQDNQDLVDRSLPSSSARQWNYDVFLSFRGPDTRKGITFELYDRLHRRGIKTFMDDQDLQVGDTISPTLLKAIEASKLAIVVLSEKYASSTWCLEELTKICECMKDDNRILPLFYNVEPTDVRYQKRSFAEAFTRYEFSGRQRPEKVKQWRDALNKVAHFSGWDSKKYKTERELVEDIVEYVFSKVQPVAINMGDFEEFEATRQAMNMVMRGLKDDKVTAIGVYGMGGVGKTTLVKHVSDQARKNGIFHHVIMATISQIPDLRKIQGQLADLLGFEFMEETEIGRAARLTKEIMRRNKILVILDDIWERMDMSIIGIPSYEELQKCNSKVLLTTRIWNVCHVMRCQEKITLNILSKDDSWTLFVRNAGRSFLSTNFENVARKVAGECRGLPIALIAVAKALGDKDLVEWERAAQRLEKSQTANPDDKGDASECIRLSYDYLKNEDYRSCFLLCCLFPEDYDIQVETLFSYVIGKGLFRDAETIDEARGTTNLVVAHLKNCSLLLDSEEDGCVRMHDVIRDTAMMIAKSKDGHGFLVKAGSGLKHWSCRLHEGYSAISLMKNKLRKLPEELVCPKLQILLLQENADLDEIPEKFIQSANELKVLDLGLTSILSLPQSLSLLTNLQALYLDFCKKRVDISIIGKLTNLEILTMRGYPVKDLSRELWREVGKLTNLRMLDFGGISLVGGGTVTIPSKVISKLQRLEELYMLYCGFEVWGSHVEGEVEETYIGFDELTRLSNLKIVQVCISDAKCIPKEVEVEPNWVYFDIRIDGSTSNPYKRNDLNSRSSSLNTTISSLPDWFVNVVTEKSEKLLYENNCKGLSNILMEYDHGRLHGLKHLSVIGPNKNLKELMNTTTRINQEPVFESLEELHLSCLDCMKELCVGDLPAGSLFNMKLLRIRDCRDLGNVLLPSKLLQRLPNLEVVFLYRICKLEYVFGCSEFEPEHSKLREVTLLELDAVRSICNGQVPHVMFWTLKSLFIYHCKSLGSLFTYDAAECLFQLEELWIETCPLLDRVIETSKATVNNNNNKNKKIVLSKLKKLVLKELPVLYSGGATTEIDIECPSLEHLYVKDCPHLSFPTSASDYFHSRNQIQLNDQQQYDVLYYRIWSPTLES
ncbi:PREDICTED: disease resistance protein At4g27190-like [Fragaria vesca subsp. vesca]